MDNLAGIKFSKENFTLDSQALFDFNDTINTQTLNNSGGFSNVSSMHTQDVIQSFDSMSHIQIATAKTEVNPLDADTGYQDIISLNTIDDYQIQFTKVTVLTEFVEIREIENNNVKFTEDTFQLANSDSVFKSELVLSNNQGDYASPEIQSLQIVANANTPAQGHIQKNTSVEQQVEEIVESLGRAEETTIAEEGAKIIETVKSSGAAEIVEKARDILNVVASEAIEKITKGISQTNEAMKIAMQDVFDKRANANMHSDLDNNDNGVPNLGGGPIDASADSSTNSCDDDQMSASGDCNTDAEGLSVGLSIENLTNGAVNEIDNTNQNTQDSLAQGIDDFLDRFTGSGQSPTGNTVGQTPVDNINDLVDNSQQDETVDLAANDSGSETNNTSQSHSNSHSIDNDIDQSVESLASVGINAEVESSTDIELSAQIDTDIPDFGSVLSLNSLLNSGNDSNQINLTSETSIEDTSGSSAKDNNSHSHSHSNDHDSYSGSFDLTAGFSSSASIDNNNISIEIEVFTLADAAPGVSSLSSWLDLVSNDNTNPSPQNLNGSWISEIDAGDNLTSDADNQSGDASINNDVDVPEVNLQMDNSDKSNNELPF